MTIGTIVYCKGLNMQCKPVICQSHVVGFKPDGRVVVQGRDGVRVILGIADLYLTKEAARAAN